MNFLLYVLVLFYYTGWQHVTVNMCKCILFYTRTGNVNNYVICKISYRYKISVNVTQRLLVLSIYIDICIFHSCGPLVHQSESPFHSLSSNKIVIKDTIRPIMVKINVYRSHLN